MPRIPVVIRERSKAPHKADVRCTNHGNAMNCPTENCPGIVADNPQSSEKRDLEINMEVMHRRIRGAVEEFERLHPGFSVAWEAEPVERGIDADNSDDDDGADK
jgi:hypothetical protein